MPSIMDRVGWAGMKLDLAAPGLDWASGRARPPSGPRGGRLHRATAHHMRLIPFVRTAFRTLGQREHWSASGPHHDAERPHTRRWLVGGPVCRLAAQRRWIGLMSSPKLAFESAIMSRLASSLTRYKCLLVEKERREQLGKYKAGNWTSLWKRAF